MAKENMTVVIFPYQFACTTKLTFLYINILPAIMKISFAKTIIKTGKGIIFCIVSMVSAVNCKHLSASGSANFPKDVIKLNFLAITPSKTSVIHALIKITIAIMYSPLYKKCPKTGTSKNLIMVRMFGIFTYSPPDTIYSFSAYSTSIY